MTQISSTTLFNFTDKLDYLIDNLKNGFYAQTTYEKLPLKNNGYTVPMVCFCDIPLGMIKNHLDWYGKFGIGIKRSYARSHNVNPVWYVHSDNSFVKRLVKSKDISDHDKKHLLPYLKQFLGYQKFKGEDKRKKFYDEREWRYVPSDVTVELHLGKRKSDVEKSLNIDKIRMPLDLSLVRRICR